MRHSAEVIPEKMLGFLPVKRTPPKEPSPAADNSEQSKRIIDMAREVGLDESPEAFDRAFKKVVSQKSRAAQKRL